MNKRMLIKAMLKLKCLTFSSSFLFSGLVLSSQSVASFFPGSEGAKRSAAGQFNPGQQVYTANNNVKFCIIFYFIFQADIGKNIYSLRLNIKFK